MPPAPTDRRPGQRHPVVPDRPSNFHGSATDPEDGALPAPRLEVDGVAAPQLARPHVRQRDRSSGELRGRGPRRHRDLQLRGHPHRHRQQRTEVEHQRHPAGRGSDTTPPTAPTNLTATAAGADPGRPGLDRGDRQRRRGRLPRRAMPGTPAAPNFAQIGTPTGTTYTDIGRRARRPATATGCGRSTPSGNLGGYSNVGRGDHHRRRRPRPPGLVAGYTFDEGAGSTVTDVSGNSNNGTVKRRHLDGRAATAAASTSTAPAARCRSPVSRRRST